MPPPQSASLALAQVNEAEEQAAAEVAKSKERAKADMAKAKSKMKAAVVRVGGVFSPGGGCADREPLGIF